jgi:hypothetical protein
LPVVLFLADNVKELVFERIAFSPFLFFKTQRVCSSIKLFDLSKERRFSLFVAAPWLRHQPRRNCLSPELMKFHQSTMSLPLAREARSIQR